LGIIERVVKRESEEKGKGEGKRKIKQIGKKTEKGKERKYIKQHIWMKIPLLSKY